MNALLTYDTKEAAEYLKVSRGTLANWRVEGTGPKYYTPQGKVIYYRADMDEWIKRNKDDKNK